MHVPEMVLHDWLSMRARLRYPDLARRYREAEAAARDGNRYSLELVMAQALPIYLSEQQTPPPEPACHVTLTQMAAIVNKSKSTLERLRNSGKLPEPAVKGGTGRADEWLWSAVRPILEHEYSRQLPEVFPADRFVRR